MFKKKIVLIVSVIAVFSGYCAADTIENEIGSYQQTSDMNKIIGARQMLYDKVKSGNINKAGEVYDYLETKIDTSTYAVFYNLELFETAILLRKYDVFASTAIISSYLDHDNMSQANHLTAPPNDGLSKKLLNLITENKSAISDDFHKNMKKEEADFVMLVTDHLTTPNYKDKNNQEKRNRNADTYLILYPNSKYESFIRNNMRFVYVRSSFGWGMYIGIGVLTYSGNISDYLPTSVAMDFGLDINYKKLIFTLDLNGNLPASLKRSFVYDSTLWPQGKGLESTSGGIIVGYKAYDKKNSLTPFIGLENLSIYPDPNDKGFNPQNIKDTNIVFGVSWDIPIGGEKNPNWFDSEYTIRNRILVSKPDIDDQLKGTRVSVTSSIAFSMWKNKRQY